MTRPTPTHATVRHVGSPPAHHAVAVRAAIVVLAAVAWLMTMAAPADAHSTLLRACPGPGDTVHTVDEIRLDFARPVLDDGVANIDLLADNGQTALELGPATFSDDGLTLTASGPGELAAGSYIIRYQATSDDGDLTDGGHQFTVDPDASVQSETCQHDDGGSGTTAAGWVLLGLGAAAMAVVFFFLRPRSDDDEADPTA